MIAIVLPFMITPPFRNKKAVSPISFGNPAVFKIYRMFWYGGSASNPAVKLTQRSKSNSQVPHLGFKDP
jgi:hypothetical protein